MILELNIEELILQGLRPDSDLAEEIEEELERLLREEGVPEALKYGNEICIGYEEADMNSHSGIRASESIARIIYQSLSKRI